MVIVVVVRVAVHVMGLHMGKKRSDTATLKVVEIRRGLL